MKDSFRFPMTAVICIASVAFSTSLWISIVAIVNKNHNSKNNSIE